MTGAVRENEARTELARPTLRGLGVGGPVGTAQPARHRVACSGRFAGWATGSILKAVLDPRRLSTVYQLSEAPLTLQVQSIALKQRMTAIET